jgi:hypothetical protein
MKNTFEEKGYCVVKNAISQELRDIITQYALFDEMQNYVPEKEFSNSPQVANAHSKYADPAMESLLIHLQKKLEEETKLTLYPTYSYYRIYRPGDDLEIHKDRPSCEISATLCFNYNYNDSKYQWPIFMEGTPIYLSAGDMVVYRGCDLNHWRDLFDLEDECAWQVQGFFHYVDADGPFKEYKYDKRDSIGIKKTHKASKSYITYV